MAAYSCWILDRPIIPCCAELARLTRSVHVMGCYSLLRSVAGSPTVGVNNLGFVAVARAEPRILARGGKARTGRISKASARYVSAAAVTHCGTLGRYERIRRWTQWIYRLLRLRTLIR